MPAAFLIVVSLASSVRAQTVLPSGFREVVVADGLDGPTSFAFLPDSTILVATKHGEVYVVREGAALPAPILTLGASEESERGLSGVTIDPNFSVNGFIYIYYTTTATSCPL